MENGEKKENGDLLEKKEDKLIERETWNRKIDFLFSLVGFSVGLGNVWRFPYLCYKNGGGAFLIPYFICVVVGGVPIFFLEASLGQFMARGGMGTWRICPLFQGIGLATMVIPFLVNIYYNVILAWAFYYVFASFTSVLPWSHCDNYWNTENCSVTNSMQSNRTLNGSEINTTTAMVINTGVQLQNDNNISALWENSSFIPSSQLVDPVTEFWERKVLGISTGIEDVGTVKWDLALCLLLAWVVVYFIIWKGIKTSGKVMYFTASAPYVFMIILLIRGLTLPGAMDGIKFFVFPKLSMLKNTQVWVDAGTQIFYTYSVSMGTLTALGSYNKFHHNCWRDTIAFALVNSGTSILAGFVIFSVLGFMAFERGVGVGEVAESGPGLAFIAYPKAVAQMPLSVFWSVAFFLMIILLGLDSQFVAVEGVITGIVDQFPRFLRKGYRREGLILCVCLVSFLLGLTMVTNGGMYLFQIFDFYSSSRVALLISLAECFVLAYLYGVNRFYDNLEMMFGFRLSPYMKICWLAVTPMYTIIVFGLSIYSYTELVYNRTYFYPTWAIVFGWMLSLLSILMIPLVMIFKLLRANGSWKTRIQTLIRPKLCRHQLREQDSPLDLAPDEYRIYKDLQSHELKDAVTDKDKLLKPKNNENGTTTNISQVA